jgi:hypothetical protein
VIEEIGRAVVQRVNFRTHTAYRMTENPKGARAVFHEGNLTERGIYATAVDMELKPGEILAVWEITAGDDRPLREAAQDLPPRPSRLMMRGADGKLMELNPSYIDINNRPPDYEPILPAERRMRGL